MAAIDVTDGTVDISFTAAEKVLGFVRGFSFPTDAVESVEVLADGIGALRGIRAPGLSLPRVRYAGTWRHRHGKDLVSVRRGQPALRITLRDQPYAAVIIGVDDPAAKKALLQAA